MALTLADVSPILHNYLCTVVKVKDGDTLVLAVDLGFTMWFRKLDCRLLGINCPTKSTPAGKAAALATIDWVTWPDPFIVHTVKLPDGGDKQEKYGRYLVELSKIGDPVTLNQWLLDNGHAVPYDGTGPRD